jgi:hypothetical protein
VAYYPANYPMTQFPAGMGYVAAPVAHPGANLPRSSPLLLVVQFTQSDHVVFTAPKLTARLLVSQDTQSSRTEE